MVCTDMTVHILHVGAGVLPIGWKLESKNVHILNEMRLKIISTNDITTLYFAYRNK